EGDVVVVALGADLDPAATPGLPEGGHDFYTEAGAFALRDVLAAFDGGRVIVAVTSTPFKCPPAPSETALLMHDFLADRGFRGRAPTRRGRCWTRSRSEGSTGTRRRWCAGSTRRAESRCWAMASRCRTTSSS